MIQRFQVQGFLARFKPVRQGYLLFIGEPPHNHLSHPTYHNLVIWGKQAEAIGPKLSKAAHYHFSGTISTRVKDGRTFINYTVDTWKRLDRPVPQPKRRPEIDEDWHVPSPLNRDSKANRRYEGFPAR